MSRTSTKITIDRQKVYARHGVLPQESLVGAYYYVSVELETETDVATVTDSLRDTMNYADISRMISEEMAVRSNLLEHVAGRIKDRILAACPSATRLSVRIVKENPPLGVECQGAAVEIIYSLH